MSRADFLENASNAFLRISSVLKTEKRVNQPQESIQFCSSVELFVFHPFCWIVYKLVTGVVLGIDVKQMVKYEKGIATQEEGDY